MPLSLITPAIAFGKLAQITPLEDPRTSWDVFALGVVGVLLFVALTSLLTLRARPAFPKLRRVSRRDRPFVPNAWGLDRRIDPDAVADDPAPHPPAP